MKELSVLHEFFYPCTDSGSNSDAEPSQNLTNARTHGVSGIQIMPYFWRVALQRSRSIRWLEGPAWHECLNSIELASNSLEGRLGDDI
jgi:hypothetical protein